MKKSLAKLLPDIREKVVLAPYTTYKVGGPARWFFAAENEDNVVKAVLAAKKAAIPFFILGGGSNLLVSDKGFNGLVIKIQNSKFKIQNSAVEADAGADMPTLVAETARLGWGGLEWAGGLPGTFGGAIRGNAGAFGGEIKDAISEVRALDYDGNVRVFSKEECDFSYRSSIFKKGELIILSAKLRLRSEAKNKLIEEAESHIRYRRERQPLEYPNAGSVFKNCALTLFSEEQQKEFEDVIKTDPFPVVPTAHLISCAGLKGTRIGGAVISEKHPNFIINAGNAKARDIIGLLELAEQKVMAKYGIKLEREIQLIGF